MIDKYPLTAKELAGLSRPDRRKHNWYGFLRTETERKKAVLSRRRRQTVRDSRRRNR